MHMISDNEHVIVVCCRLQVESVVQRSDAERARLEQQLRQLGTHAEEAARRANEAELRVRALESELERSSAQLQRLTSTRIGLSLSFPQTFSSIRELRILVS